MNNKNALTIPEQKKLEQLARTIADRYDTTESLVKSARERSQEAIAEAILCGQALNDAKEIVGHGSWLKWLKEHCKGVTPETCRKYMVLANSNHGCDLTDCKSIRQAYITAGIIRDSDAEQSTAPAPASEPEAAAEPVKAKGESPEVVMRLRSEITRQSAMDDLNMRAEMLRKDIEGLAEQGVIEADDAKNVIAVVAPTLTPEERSGPETSNLPTQETECVVGQTESDERDMNDRWSFQAAVVDTISLIIIYKDRGWFIEETNRLFDALIEARGRPALVKEAMA